MDGLLGELLPEHALHHILLASNPIADTDDDAASDVACQRKTQDDGRESKGAHVVGDCPRAGAQSDLEKRVAVEQDDDSDEKS